MKIFKWEFFSRLSFCSDVILFIESSLYYWYGYFYKNTHTCAVKEKKKNERFSVD